MRYRLILTAAAFLFPVLARADHVQNGLRVPAGFEVTEYAGSDLANDIYCMTLDPSGRVVVSGRGYIRVLVADALVSHQEGRNQGGRPFRADPQPQDRRRARRPCHSPWARRLAVRALRQL